ncbi:YeeE/YedE thiosulfate transporter family protein [Novosphingobium aquiterrae]|uniref:YeeE/YedE thiosulfate transporter family protein n=1 Tax=Novosphingobium aquiterrae TaxID=624388 RepID=A0ABV6PEN0_9SPHN
MAAIPMGFPADHQLVAFLVAMLAAALMGFAIQQGGTCMVGAVSQIVTECRTGRAMALAECCLWVVALGMAGLVAGLHFQASPAFPVDFMVATGGLLLGFGAWLNDACVFGSIARIGNRDFNYLFTPPGYFLGSLTHARFAGDGLPSMPMSPLPGKATVLLLLLFAGSVIVSLRQLRALQRSGLKRRQLWDYRHATITIGIAFVALAVLAGPWTYTEALWRAAHRRSMPSLGDIVLFAALLAGAVIGGRKIARTVKLSARRALFCLIGGALMGLGAALVPGGNDNLILAGLPWLQPHAWLAIGAMALTIAAGLLVGRVWRKLFQAGFESRASRV